MIKYLNTKTQKFSAIMVSLAVASMSSSAYAATTTNFSTYTKSVGNQSSVLENAVNMTAYIGGALIAVVGVLGVKQHVENPGQMELKKPISKIMVGGALLAFPSVADLMQNSMGSTGNTSSTVLTSAPKIP